MKDYEVIATYKVRQRKILQAQSEQDAQFQMDKILNDIDWLDTKVDTLMSSYSTTAKAVK